MHSQLFRTLVVVSLAAPAVLAQAPVPNFNPNLRQGTASSYASGLSLDVPDNEGSNDELRIKGVGGQSNLPPRVSATAAPNVVDRSHQAMFGALASQVKIDGHSGGSEIIPRGVWSEPLTSSGYFYPELSSIVNEEERWMAALFSIQNGSPGDIAGTNFQRWVYQRSINAGGANQTGSDIYGHYLTGSVGIAPRLVGDTLIEQTAEQNGLTSGEDIDALDHGFGVTAWAQNAGIRGLFEELDMYYFSVTPWSAAALTAAGGLGNVQTVSPSAIYLTELVGGVWTPVVEYRSPADLGISDGENVDALSVDSRLGTVVFSTEIPDPVPANPVSQLRFQDPAGPFVGDLLDEDGIPVTDRVGIGAGIDDIDGVCIHEPEKGEFSPTCGIAAVDGITNLPLVPLTAEPMGLSACSIVPTAAQAGNITYFVEASQRGGAAANTSGIVLFFLNLNLPQTMNDSTFPLLMDANQYIFSGNAESRPAGTPGDRVNTTLVLPPLPLFAGFPFGVSAQHLDAQGLVVQSLVSVLLLP